jgi:hypothetical protein
MCEYNLRDMNATVLARLVSERAEIYSFSCYIWNVASMLDIAADLKALLPDSKIIFGGAEVSFATERFELDFIDHIICGEGEDAIVKVCEAIKSKESIDRIIEGGIPDVMKDEGILYREGDFESGIENNARFNAVKAIAATEGAETLPICAEMEAQIASLSVEEKELFLADLGLEKSGLDRLIKTCYDLLGLISYLTAGKPEVRAWTIQKGTKAPGAAGKIHTDFERGFIRAEVVAFNDLMSSGSMTAAKEKGLVRSEGKEYVMQDGDVVLFRFNV